MHSPDPAKFHAREHLSQASLLFRHFKHRDREIAHPALKNLSILKTDPPAQDFEEAYVFVVVAIQTISTKFPEVKKRACRALEGMGLYRHEMIAIYEAEEEDREWDMIEDEIKEFEEDLKGGYEMVEVVEGDVVSTDV